MSTKLERGLVIGPYQLDFRLGVGGMGEVWSARQEGGDRVAIKLLRTDLDPADHQLFVDEARTALVLEHPNIVRTYDVGDASELGYYYIVMEQIAGPSVSVLLQTCQQQDVKVAPEVVAYIGQQIARALHYAHAEANLGGRLLHLVHRDLTPHNILLDPAGRALLTDFGVARTDVQEHRTQTGTIRGKPAYMSPEQVSQEPVDQRTDLFSLGIVLYEMATLRRLFGRANMILSIRALVEDEPVPIPQLVPGFPEPLWEVIAQMLQKRRNKRIGSAAEVDQALSALGPTMPNLARAPATLAAFLGWLYPAGSFDAERISQKEGTQSTTTAPDLAAATEPQEDEALTELDRRQKTVSWPVLDQSGALELPPVQPLDLRDILDTKLPERPAASAEVRPEVAPARGLGLGILMLAGIGVGLSVLVFVAWWVSRPLEPEIPRVTLVTRSLPPPVTSTTAVTRSSTTSSP
ncbi:MAG: serine/threonine protein kinase [Deltaproteobacteria bacterium]|nr:serine/threonine protein kinase [Deltaproteobacteria bacterium]